MITCKEIDDYIQYAEDHPAWINKDRKLLIRNIVKPLLKRDDVFFDEETFQNCIRYCEGNYYPLFPFQKFIYAFVFMYADATKTFPLFRKFFIMMGRGNGKDGFIVPLANFLQTPLYGIKNYHVAIVANSEDQAKDTFNVCWNMLEEHRQKFRGKFHWTRELITNLSTGAEMKYNTSGAGTKDGKRIGCLVMNELHAYENYTLINVFESAQGKIQHPREFVITTQGYVREGPLDDGLSLCGDILRTGENELQWFPFICKIDKETEVDDAEAWHKANPSLEYMPLLAHEIKMEYLEMQKLPSKRPEFLTKRMNLPSQREEATVTSWENILRCCYSDIERKTPRPVPDTTGGFAVVGIDYADIRDFASAGILTKTDDDEFIWRQHTWINMRSPFFDGIKFPISNIGQDGFRDFEVVDAPVIPPERIVEYVLREFCAKYIVQKIALDTWRYSLFKKAFTDNGLTVEDRNDPNGTIRLIRRLGSATAIIAPYIEQCFAEGRINYGQSAIMRWYTNNVAVLTDKFGNKQFGKIEPKLRKTDGFMAFNVAMYCKDALDVQTFYI